MFTWDVNGGKYDLRSGWESGDAQVQIESGASGEAYHDRTGTVFAKEQVLDVLNNIGTSIVFMFEQIRALVDSEEDISERTI